MDEPEYSFADLEAARRDGFTDGIFTVLFALSIVLFCAYPLVVCARVFMGE